MGLVYCGSGAQAHILGAIAVSAGSAQMNLVVRSLSVADQTYISGEGLWIFTASSAILLLSVIISLIALI